MRCYRCNNLLTDNGFCNSCGANVVVYKKVLKLSNTYYNIGLAKAQIRDLSGAADLLRRSIKFNKKNTNARNLLGLVYFEMGEAVQAMAEWVISKNYQPENNLADRYMKMLQSNPNRLDTINQTIKKFNVALGYAREENDDLAIIQLKKVLNLNPNLIKGHQLLALIYMKRGEYDKAKKPVMKSLKIDNSNILSKRYLKEIEHSSNKKAGAKDTQNKKPVEYTDTRKRFKPEFDTGANEPLSGYDVIIPNNGYKESNSGTLTVLNVIIGIVIGVAATFFLLTPARISTLNALHKSEVLDLNSEIARLNSEISDLETKVAAANDNSAALQGQIDNANSEKDIMIADYEKLITAYIAFQGKSYIECADGLSGISAINTPDFDAKYSESFKNICNMIKDESYTEAAKAAYSEAVSLYDSAENVESLNTVAGKLERCFVYNFQEVDYKDAIEKLRDAYTKRYQAAQTEAPDHAQEYKDMATAGMQSVLDRISTAGGSSSAVKTAQEALAALQAM